MLEEFVNDRFLARVFHAPDAPWVLKGGTAVLARVDDARTTKDVDLLGELDDIDVALGACDPQPRSTSATTSGSSSPATTGPSLVQVNPTWTGTACTWTRTAER